MIACFRFDIFFSFEVKAVQGNYTEWSEWSDCSSNCGTGERFRTRNCTSPPPAFGGMDCSFIGMDRDAESCEKRACASTLNGFSIHLLQLEIWSLLEVDWSWSVNLTLKKEVMERIYKNVSWKWLYNVPDSLISWDVAVIMYYSCCYHFCG